MSTNNSFLSLYFHSLTNIAYYEGSQDIMAVVELLPVCVQGSVDKRRRDRRGPIPGPGCECKVDVWIHTLEAAGDQGPPAVDH